MGQERTNRKVADLIRIAICDDERAIREQLAELVEKQGADCQVELFATGDELLAVAASMTVAGEKLLAATAPMAVAGKELLAAAASAGAGNRHFDIIFLDIQMEGRNGMETARALRGADEQAVLIFVTAIKEYVFQAFDVGAFHYLIKPVSEPKFAEVFARARREAEKRQKEETPVLFIKGRKRSVTLRQKDIRYIESQSNKVVIHTERDEIEAWQSIQKLEGRLGNSFYRCHRGYLVNMAHITEYSGSMIELDNGGQAYLSKEKYPGFVKAYMRYLEGGGAENV